MLNFGKGRRRAKVRGQPFPTLWLSLIERNVPYYGLLPPEDQAELRGHIRILVVEKNFEGCAGLEMTDEIRVTIAAQACLLLLHRKTGYFPRLGSILVYPEAFVAPREERDETGLIREGKDVLDGESWDLGALLLSWEDVRRDALVFDGQNVVLHEFAHQLDQADGDADGLPTLMDPALRREWGEVLSREYKRLVTAARNHQPTLINEYGAKDPAEFFAVVTETFFKRPHKLQERHRDLYDVFRRFYCIDPATFFA